MKALKKLIMMAMMVIVGLNVMSCSDEESVDSELDSSLLGEWVEDSDNYYVFDYYYFASDGTGIHGSYESDIDWVNEDDDIEWYTVNDEFLYIDGVKYEYSCDGSTLKIERNGRVRYYYEK